MKEDSIFQTEIYLKSFGIESKRFEFDGNEYIYAKGQGHVYIVNMCQKHIFDRGTFFLYF